MASRRSRNSKRSRPDDDDEPTTDVASADMLASDVEGEDLHNPDTVNLDYKPMPGLDRYERSGLDNRQYGAMDADARRTAEATMAARERATKRSRVAGAGAGMAVADDDDEVLGAFGADELRAQIRDRKEAAAAGGEGGEEGEAIVGTIEDDVSLRQWATTDAGYRFIRSTFYQLLTKTTDATGASVYEQKINAMCADNKQTLEVSWLDMINTYNQLAVLLADAPKQVLKVFDETAKDVVLSLFTDYESIHDEIHVRITDMPLHDSLRELRQVHLNALVQVTGVVTRRSVVFPQLKIVRFTCQNCKHLTPQMYTHEGSEIKLGSCPECQRNGPFTLNSEHSVYRNYQTLTLQETPGSVPAGRVPRYKEVILLADLIDKARPGDEVDVTGIYTNRFDVSLNTRQGFPVFSTVIEANNIVKREVATANKAITEEDKKQLLELSRDPRIIQRIIKSIAPSVYGQEHMKTAVAMSMFGGVRKVSDRHRIRGDINVLLLGDPGTAKSQCLKYVEKTAPRAVFTTGKGASAVGLTAAVHKDPMTGEYTLEGGALVLADQGTCLIDEFDKMNDQDRTSIHEAMEQQSISISKAGIVTSLQARCSVVAAANPIGGRYDPQKSFSENVALTDPILQRFDVLCVLQDKVDPVNDERLAQFVVKSHAKSHPIKRLQQQQDAEADIKAEEDEAKDPDIIPQNLLKKYIMYARRRNPQFTNFHTKKIAELYAHLRQSSERHNGIPIAVRHIESIMRMAEAHARMRLSDQVEDSDADAAIRVMLDSFVQSQKYSAMRALRKEFSKYITTESQHHDLLLHLLQTLVAEQVAIRKMQVRGLAARGADASGSQLAEAEADEAALEKDIIVPQQSLMARGREYGIHDSRTLTSFTKSDMFKKAGFLLTRDGRISRSFASVEA